MRRADAFPSTSMNPTSQEPTPYPEVNGVLVRLHARVKDILKQHFVGMYLYGSLATGGFEPARSDIDFVVISEYHLPEALIRSLESMHMDLLQEADKNKWLRKLEGAYVPKAIIRRHDPGHPPVPIINEGKFYRAPLGSDWILQRHVLRQSRTGLSGPPLDDLIDPVSPDDLKAAILDVIDVWWQPMLENPDRLRAPGYQPFAVLSMCRALYTISKGELVSKERAALWALETLPQEWSSLIRRALEWGDGDEIESIDRTTALMQHVIGLCRQI